MTSVWGSSFVSPAGGATTPLVSSSSGEQHMLPAQASPQARLQTERGGREGSSLWTTGVVSLPEDPEEEANSGCTVQQLTPTLCSTLVTPDITSVHLDICKMQKNTVNCL